jgi:hypothetical protein
LKGVGSKTRGREGIITDFDKPEKGRIYLLASCKTLGEGIDTKYANMEIPINPGGSVIYEQQKLGRITRNPGGNNPNGIVLIPCWIDMDKYEGLDKYERDDMIRQELHEGGNFNTFLNVMSAYKNQCDPELWELCLKYPNMYSPKEIKGNLDKQGFKVDESKGDLIENVNHIVDKDLSELVGENDEETIQNIVSTGKQFEIHSQDKDLPIITYGSETDEEPIRLFKDENDVYHPVSKKEPTEPKRKIEKPDKLKRKKLVNVHMNDEIKVLWKIDESSFDNIDGAFCHGVLDAEIEYDEKRFERWYENLEKAIDYIKINEKPPSSIDKNPNVKILGKWFSRQNSNYKNKTGILKEAKIREKWEDFMRIYGHLVDNKIRWRHKLNNVKDYIKKTNKLPLPGSKNKEIKTMGYWIANQKNNYRDKCETLKEPDIRKEWEEFIEENKLLFMNHKEIWDDNLKNTVEYIQKYNKPPSCSQNQKEKDINIYKLGLWLSSQKSNYENKKYNMTDEYYVQKWEEFMKDYGICIDEKLRWIDNLNKSEKYILDFNKLPSFYDKSLDEEYKSLPLWIRSQKSNYENNKNNMKNEFYRNKWKYFIEKYSKYFVKDTIYNGSWKDSYDILVDYNKKHGIPKNEDIVDGFKIGDWCSRQRGLKNKNKLSEDKIKLLEELDGWKWDIIKSNWSHYYELTKIYMYEKKIPPKSQYKVDTGENIGSWCNTQRQEKKKNKLSQKKIKLLEELDGWIWDFGKEIVRNEWETNYIILKKYHVSNNSIPSSNVIYENIKIGDWCDRQRQTYKKNKLDEEKVKLLELLDGWMWEKKNDKWDINYDLLKKYIIENGSCPPNGYKIDGINLGYWCGTQRAFKKENKLSQGRINKLDELNCWWWEYDNDIIWEEKFKELETIINNTGKLPKSGGWINVQRREYKAGNISEYRVNKLEKLGGGNIWYWHESEEWDKKFNILLDYIKEFNKLPVGNKKHKLLYKNFNIGSWCQIQRSKYQNNKLPEERINKLNGIELWYWNWDDMNFNKYFNCLIKYIKNNDNQLPKQKIIYEDLNIGNWVSDRRNDYKLNRLSNDKIKKLEEIDVWYWEKDDFMIKYDILKDYINDIGELPKINTKYKEINLGSWCDGRRQDYKNDRLSKEKINLLEKISGWYWSFDTKTDFKQIIRKEWWLSYNNLKEYQIKYPGEIPSESDKDPSIKKLGRFCGKQRRLKNKKCRKDELPLSQEKKDLLEKIPGWYWSYKDKTKKDMSKKEIKPKSKKETTEQKRERTKSEISILHQKYKTMNSQTLHKHFEDNPDDWEKYHKISEENEDTFPDEEIPYKKIIEYLDKVPGKKPKDVADLGCGKARVCEHFSDYERFKFINMDHVSCNDLVQKRDIKYTGLDDYSMDIVVLSLAMWGSNCKDYITEANRILIENGVLLIIEATKRWTDEKTGENNLVKLLEDNNFTIKNINEEKFMFIECIKK